MRHKVILAACMAVLATPLNADSIQVPPAIYSDPAPDAANPAAMEVLHIPSEDVEINGLIYIASGAGPHPTLVLCHGWPGNEKNLDLAQTVRRAGWNVVTFNYRGSWGSPGNFKFAQNPQDAQAVLAFLREEANAEKYRVNSSQLAIMGHSMGGWVTAMVAGQDDDLLGAGLISAANMGLLKGLPREQLLGLSANSKEALAGTSAERMTDELIDSSAEFDFRQHSAGLASKPLLVLSSDDGLQPHTEELIRLVRDSGGTQVSAYHAPTDHSWSDRRIDLATQVVTWLGRLVPPEEATGER